MRKYETIFVIDSLLKSEEIDNIINKYERFISANGGQIEAIERWGKKRLAYEIKKRQYGYYVLIRFDGLPTMIKPLEREYRLNESLLRFKTLLMPKVALKHLADQQNKAAAAKEAAEAAKPVSTPTEENEAPPEATAATEPPVTTEETVAPEEAPASEEATATEPEAAAETAEAADEAVGTGEAAETTETADPAEAVETEKETEAKEESEENKE